MTHKRRRAATGVRVMTNVPFGSVLGLINSFLNNSRRWGGTPMDSKMIRCASLAFLLALASTGTSAALIDQGDTTLDNVTNMEWLDLTATQGLSVNGFLASNFVSVDGWSIADVGQVEGLLRNLFVGPQYTPFPDTDGSVVETDPVQLAAVNAAFDLFGETGATNNGTGPFGEGLALDMAGGASFAGVCQPFYQKFLEFDGNGLAETGESIVTSFCAAAFVDMNGSLESVGVWAYRDVAAIPIPAAAWLFGSALGLLAWMRRKAT